MSRRLGLNSLALLLVCLGVYFVITAGILAHLYSKRWSNNVSSQSSILNLPMMHESESINEYDDSDDTTWGISDGGKRTRFRIGKQRRVENPAIEEITNANEEEVITNDKQEEVTTNARENCRVQTCQEYTCDTQNGPDFLPDDDVIKRSLHGVVIGAMKSGTQALHQIILAHPRTLTAGKGHGELHFFNNRGLNRNSPEGSPSKRSAFSSRIPRRDVRDAFEWVLRDRTGLNSRRNGTFDITNEQNKDKVGIHSGKFLENRIFALIRPDA